MPRHPHCPAPILPRHTLPFFSKRQFEISFPLSHSLPPFPFTQSPTHPIPPLPLSLFLGSPAPPNDPVTNQLGSSGYRDFSLSPHASRKRKRTFASPKYPNQITKYQLPHPNPNANSIAKSNSQSTPKSNYPITWLIKYQIPNAKCQIKKEKKKRTRTC